MSEQSEPNPGERNVLSPAKLRSRRANRIGWVVFGITVVLLPLLAGPAGQQITLIDVVIAGILNGGITYIIVWLVLWIASRIRG